MRNAIFLLRSDFFEDTGNASHYRRNFFMNDLNEIQSILKTEFAAFETSDSGILNFTQTVMPNGYAVSAGILFQEKSKW